MSTIFLGSEALERNELTPGQLRYRYREMFPGVYTPRVAQQSLYANTVGAFLWARRRAAITGLAAAAIHGSQWIDEHAPIELLSSNHHPPPGIITRDERIFLGEVTDVAGMVVATPERTACDIGRHHSLGEAVAHLDALARATGLKAEDVAPLIDRNKGARGIRSLRTAIDLMDGGAQSPKETWLRLLLIKAGYPRPTLQIPVLDNGGYPFAFLDMGWEHVKIAVEYDGAQHGTDAEQWRWDVKRLRMIHDRDWLHVKVIAGDRKANVLARVAEAWQARAELPRTVAKSAR
jgi:hypothetical protein